MKISAYPKNFRSLTKKDFAPAQVWFVYFTFTDPATGKKARIKLKKDINRIDNLKDRQEAMSALITAVKEMLADGWNPLTRKVESDHDTLSGALDYVYGFKKPTLRQRSAYNYDSTLKTFKAWLNVNHLDFQHPARFKEADARRYMDYLLTEKKYKGKSHNNILTDLRVFFNAMVEREIIPKNPFKGIKKKPVEVGRNVAFTDDEVERLDAYLKAKNFRLWLFKEFIYSAGIRRTELTRIRISDVKDTHIILRSDVSKNKKQESVAINQRLRSAIEAMQLDRYPPDFYLFGRGLKTSGQQFVNPNHISAAHRKATDALGIRKECTLYSWKHTAAVRLYAKTRDPYLIMKFFRHSSLAMTMIYLKSLGLDADERLRDVVF